MASHRRPNVIGNIIMASYESAASVGNGCFSNSPKIYDLMVTPGSYGYFQRTLTMNASNSNTVFTDSGKVYPLSLALNFIIKA